ncbi:hypothetical protein A0U95_16745 [Pseudomonas brassicacearum]|nr:hypothetical protein A0U95_16745 [Pseudomonas brassicacearum]ROM91377.1 hypothetical protein BK656_22060 [Pseudomonas brassicacearum]RON03277.1 hypothetical protein BK657_14260 [Pseudomonas brassicacearum]
MLEGHLAGGVLGDGVDQRKSSGWANNLTANGQKQTFKPLAKYTVAKIALKNFGASVQPRKREDS